MLSGRTILDFRENRNILLIILVLALAIRALLAFDSDNFNHPDENFQILEQAHRLVFGYGLVPWEFRYSARSWITPGLVAIMLYPFKLIGWDNPAVYIPFVRVIMALFSLTMVFSAYHIGRKFANVRAGLWAAFLCAIWYETAYFSIRPFSEVWAATFFLAAVALSYKESRIFNHIAAGILLGLAAAIRIHYIPIVLGMTAYNLIMLKGRPLRAFLMTLLSVAILIGMWERLSFGSFYASYFNYLRLSNNFSMTDTSIWGTGINYFYKIGYASFFLGWIILILALVKWRTTGFLVFCTLAVLATHCFLPLKEHLICIRFIYIVVPLILILAGILINHYISTLKSAGNRLLWQGSILTLFIGLSLAGYLYLLPGENNPYEHPLFYKDPGLQAYRYLHDEKKLYGVYDAANFWFATGGYYYLHRDVPLYYRTNPPKSLDYVSHILAATGGSVPKEFKLIRTFGDIGVYEKSGSRGGFVRDPAYSSNMYQPGIDDRPSLSGGSTGTVLLSKTPLFSPR